MKKKLLLIFFIILIVIFLIIIFFPKDNIEESINNTIEYLEYKEYKITLTLKDIYLMNEKEFTTKIVYCESKKDDLYKFDNKMYTNGTLTNEVKSYAKEEKDKYLYYYFDDKGYKKIEINDLNEKKDFNINIKKFFSKIGTISKTKRQGKKVYYSSTMNTKDAFSLIYEDAKYENIKDKVKINIISSNNLIDSISFEAEDTKENEKYIVNLDIDYQIQEINFEEK